MIIEESDFVLTSINDDSLLFDLELVHIVKPRGGEPRKEFQIAGYGLTLESMKKPIGIARRLSDKHPEAITMQQFLEEYKSEKENLLKIIHI